MKGSEVNLAFPNILNEQLDSFSSSVGGQRQRAHKRQYEVFKMPALSSRSAIGFLETDSGLGRPGPERVHSKDAPLRFLKIRSGSRPFVTGVSWSCHLLTSSN
jgi:hypothetical protein